MQDFGRLLFWFGLGLAALGAALWLLGRLPLPLGRLPGDLRLERDGFTLYAPLTTSLLLSLLLTLLLNLFSRFK